MELPIEVKIAQAKSDVLSVASMVQTKCGLSNCIMELVLESVLAKVREDARAEVINGLCRMAHEQEQKGVEDGNAESQA